MGASLWQKLLSAFGVVIVLGGVVQAVLVNQAIQGRFDEFVSRSGQAYAQEVAPALAAYYDANQGWNAVDAQGVDLAPTTAPAPASATPAMATPALATPAIATPAGAAPDVNVGIAVATAPTMMGGTGRMRGGHEDEAQGMVDNQNPAAASMIDGGNETHGPLNHETLMGSQMMHSQMIGGSIWTHMDVRLVLTDDQSKVIADTVASDDETTPALSTAGTPITAASRTVGTLYALNNVDSVDRNCSTSFSAAFRQHTRAYVPIVSRTGTTP